MSKFRHLFLTGSRQIGKTFIINKLLEEVTNPSGGFFTEEIIENGVRVGFQMRNLNGKTRVLAHRDVVSPFTQAGYGVDTDTFEEFGVEELERCLKNPGLIVMDELGCMEENAPCFRAMVEKILESKNHLVLGSIKQKSSNFLDMVRNRKDVDLYEINNKNRDEIFHLLKHKLLFFRGVVAQID